MQSVDGKMLEKVDALIKRENERQLEVKKRKEDKERYKDAENEKLEVFQKIYEDECKKIEQAIQNSKNLPTNTLAEHFENIYKNILNLQKYVAASNVFLRVYDIQKSNKKLQELATNTKDLEEQLLPKKKFGFKNKKSANKSKENGLTKDEVDFVKPIINLNVDYCGFKNKISENLLLNSGEVYKKDVELQNLDDCILRCYGNPSTLHLSNVKNSTILCGPVSTSIFAENCNNCTFVIACQQLRLHSSKNLKIYLHVTSKGILEDCSEVFVAPYNLDYDGLGEDFKSSGLDRGSNHWDKLDDFNWLNVKQHSPNWRVLDECDRVKSWNGVVEQR